MNSRLSFKKICIASAAAVAMSCSAILMTGCRTAMVIGAVAGAGTVVTLVVVAKYKASEQQKAVAAERARAATVNLAAHPPTRGHRAKAQAETKKIAAATNPAATTAAVETPQPARPIPTPEEMEEALTHKLPAYLAVPVPRQQIPAEEKGEATYMLWDTHRQQLVTDDVYVVKHDVRAGVTVKLNGIKAHVASAQ